MYVYRLFFAGRIRFWQVLFYFIEPLLFLCLLYADLEKDDEETTNAESDANGSSL
jgi:hypothetical protein